MCLNRLGHRQRCFFGIGEYGIEGFAGWVAGMSRGPVGCSKCARFGLFGSPMT